LQELDKTALGQRIRQIRLGKELRQWELAQKLGTTQSAVHKYEHGVVPEPRRLVELARIGGTTIEWVLTGTHWENGSTSQDRLPGEILDTASLLRNVSKEAREQLEEALRIIRDAVRSLNNGINDGELSPGSEAIEKSLQDHSADTLRLLESAWRVQRAVLKRIAQDAEDRLAPEDQALSSNRESPGVTPRR